MTHASLVVCAIWLTFSFSWLHQSWFIIVRNAQIRAGACSKALAAKENRPLIDCGGGVVEALKTFQPNTQRPTWQNVNLDSYSWISVFIHDSRFFGCLCHLTHFFLFLAAPIVVHHSAQCTNQSRCLLQSIGCKRKQITHWLPAPPFLLARKWRKTLKTSSIWVTIWLGGLGGGCVGTAPPESWPLGCWTGNCSWGGADQCVGDHSNIHPSMCWTRICSKPKVQLPTWLKAPLNSTHTSRKTLPKMAMKNLITRRTIAANKAAANFGKKSNITKANIALQ